VRAAIAAAAQGEPLDIELRIVTPDGATRLYRALGELERDEDGVPVLLRGSNQDITDQREAERALAAASIADELQRSLLPEQTFDAEQLDVTAYYRAGVAGTQVGGDWYDVVDIGAGRTALVLGDVVGRGVRAAAVMGQLRTAVRAYAQLELAPADVLECLDEVIRHLGPEQFVTCLYAVFDPRDRSLTYANAGHLPPLLAVPGEPTRRLDGVGPPVGTGAAATAERRVTLPVGALLTLYTDGLVERRGSVIDEGIDRLAEALPPASTDASALVDSLVPDGSDDDIAVLMARVLEAPEHATATFAVESDLGALRYARGFVSETLANWGLPEALLPDALLITGELVTNAVLHGKPPVELRLRRAPRHLLIEVEDGEAATPRKLRPTPSDHHGRGLQLAAAVAERWGTRPQHDRKSVWCQLPLRAEQAS
jgi:anti-sigma regulatory factor (Ser/Thr protein kinase)